MIKIQNVNQSACSLQTDSTEIMIATINQLSIYLPQYQFMPSYRAGLFDGKKKFFKIVGKGIILFPRGLVKYLLSKYNEMGYTVEYDFETTNISREEFNIFVQTLSLPFQPRDYQIDSAFESIVNKRQVNVMATGSGKSLSIYILCRYFLHSNIRVVLIVPNISLVEQMYSDFIEYGFKDIDSFCRRIGGDNKVKSFDKEITISTWQSLHKNAHLFEGVGSIIADECHRSKSAVYEDIIFPCAINCSFRLGFTGTMPNEYIHKISILSSLGPTKKYISTRELINLGLATPVTINAVFLEYPNEERRKVLGLKYQDEVKYITNHSRRNSITTKLIEKVWKNRGNTMVLFDRVEHGKILAEGLVEHIFGKEVDYKELQLADNVYNIYLITGSSPPKEREKIRHLLEEKNDAILLGTSSILSTGINIKKLHNMVLTAGGKSNIKLNQSIGRMLRTHHSKEMVYIYDLVDNFSIQYKHTVRKNSFLKQFEERLGIYQDSEYDIKETTIQL